MQASPLKGKLNVERYVEYPHIVDQHHHQSQGDAKLCPIFTADVQLLGGYDVGDVSWDQHTTGDEKPHENRLNLGYLHGWAEFSCSQSSVVQYGRDRVHPVKDLRRHSQKILVDRDLHAATQEQQGRHEEINLGAS